jgi:hypothetical protein
MGEQEKREDRSGESHAQRVDRELIEFLNELRVALPGVQTLFAFLLIVPFSNRWDRTTEFQRDVYIVAVLATALSTLLLIAPSAQHRLLFREGDKEHLLKLGNRCAVSGVAALAVAMTMVLYLIVEIVLGGGWGAVVAAAAAGSFAWVWFAVPLVRRSTRRRRR